MSQAQVYVDQDLKPLMPMFLDNRDEDIQELRDLLAEDDLEGLEELGHKIKGAGGGYGFDYVTELGREIEEAAKAGDLEEIKELVARLANYMDEVEIIYE